VISVDLTVTLTEATKMIVQQIDIIYVRCA